MSYRLSFAIVSLLIILAVGLTHWPGAATATATSATPSAATYKKSGKTVRLRSYACKTGYAKAWVNFVLRPVGKNLYRATAFYTLKTRKNRQKNNLRILRANNGSSNGPWTTVWKSKDNIRSGSLREKVPYQFYIRSGSRLAARFTIDRILLPDYTCGAPTKYLVPQTR
jgi:hypothetical protein